MYSNYVSALLVMSAGCVVHIKGQTLKCYRCGAPLSEDMKGWTDELDLQMSSTSVLGSTTQRTKDKMIRAQAAERVVPYAGGATYNPEDYPCDDPFEDSKGGKKDAFMWQCNLPKDGRFVVACLKAFVGQSVFRGCAFYKKSAVETLCVKTNNQTDCTCATDYCNVSSKVKFSQLTNVALLALVQLFVVECAVSRLSPPE